MSSWFSSVFVRAFLLTVSLNVPGCSGSDSSPPPASTSPNSPTSPNAPPATLSVAQQAYLKASNTDRFDLFGSQVALSNNTMAVSAWHESSCASGVNGDPSNNGCEFSGAVYVFVRNGNGGWTQQAYIKAANPGANNFFGIALALNGDTLAVGAPNESGCATGVNNGNGQQTTCSIAGAVYVYARAGSLWSLQAYVKPSHTTPFGAGGFFGSSVALSGDTLVVGAPMEQSCAASINGDATNNGCANAGAAYVFARSTSGWTQQAYLKAPNAEAGDRFGTSVAVSGDRAAVGATFEASCAVGIGGDLNSNGCPGAGAVYLFRRASGSWSDDAYIKASNTDSGDLFGSPLAFSGDTLAVAAAGEGSCARQINEDQHNNDCTKRSGPGAAFTAGAVYVFARLDTAWTQQAYVKPSNMDPGDRFGAALALLGDVLAVGAPAEASCATGVNGDQSNNDCGTAPITGTDTAAGAAYVFDRNAGVWTQQAYVKASNTEPNDRFGISVAVGEHMIAAGADLEASCASGVNGDQQNDSCPGAGAVYVYGIAP